MPCPICTATAIATTIGQIGVVSASARAVQRKLKESKKKGNGQPNKSSKSK